VKKSVKKITSEEFDRRFDKGKDVGSFLDVKKIKVNKEIQRVNVDFPIFLLVQIDKEARKIGVARSALIKLWLSERLKHA
jgi:hypothetical protein